ncbi:hypothetical protein PMI41_04871 [Phyllobacterium sp. YR531]|nr:hypothetical protein PMI41_04871 [Phyllobacterium sp. YR531]
MSGKRTAMSHQRNLSPCHVRQGVVRNLTLLLDYWREFYACAGILAEKGSENLQKVSKIVT